MIVFETFLHEDFQCLLLDFPHPLCKEEKLVTCEVTSIELIFDSSHPGYCIQLCQSVSLTSTLLYMMHACNLNCPYVNSNAAMHANKCAPFHEK